MTQEIFKETEFEEHAPSTSLAESVRNFGYDLNTAISDLIDNAITAEATLISVRLEWNNEKPFVSILDNGVGMTDKQLSKNIVIGSNDPNEPRQMNDLGRFGLGLKTASFSMCRQLNVLSKTTGTDVCFRSWDLDIIKQQNRWLISKKIPEWYPELNEKIRIKDHGTLVLWKKCDRLTEIFDTEIKLKETGVELIEHIGTFFCRFLEGKRKIQITVNDTKVNPWNPIPDNSRSLGVQNINGIKIHPFILPQKLTFKDHSIFEKTGGIKGWNAQQGFYIYRNNRLMINGGWLKLKRMKLDEHCKLARIIIEFDSSLDLDWHVDVSKSKASIPSGTIRQHIEAIAKKTRKDAEEVYRHRGKVVARASSVSKKFIWSSVMLPSGETSFRINKEHPVIQPIYQKYSGTRKDLNSMFSLLEKTLPTENIQISGNTGKLDSPRVQLNEVIRFAENMMEQQQNIGKSKKAALKDLITTEPFNQFSEELREYLKIYE